jgi:serpin B
VSVKRDYYIVASILVLILSVSVMSYLREKPEQELFPIEFGALLDLTDDKAVETQIISYLVNRDSKPNVVKIVNFDTINTEYNISITLQDIINTEGSSLENQTKSSQIRFFTVTFVNNSTPDIETNLSGWIDENMHVYEWNWLSIHWVNGSGHGGPWISSDNQTNRTNKTIAASNRFAFDLYKQIQIGEENILFSPYSISTAVSMVYEGARGETAEEIQSVFHFNTNETVRLLENKNLFETLNKAQGSELEIANDLWVQEGFPIEGSYASKLSEFYQSTPHQQDFYETPEEARLAINSWVENQTKNKIKDLFPEGSINNDTRLVLTNAIYFKGGWLHPFNPNKTRPDVFRVTESSNVTVDMMYLKSTRLNYTAIDGVQILELPYDNSSLSMVLLLPQNQTLAELELGLNYDTVSSWICNLKPRYVVTHIPKFSFESKYLMKETLSEMGMPRAFIQDEADFTGINPDGMLYIGEVVHQAFIEVNEAGTEAAAATGVTIQTYGSYGGERFYADHPFLFMIIDRQTDIILFMGRVIDPSA